MIQEIFEPEEGLIERIPKIQQPSKREMDWLRNGCKGSYTQVLQ